MGSAQSAAGTEAAVVINIDDVGMCHGANAAFIDLSRRGRCDSGSVMVPCPWFLEIAEAGAADPSLRLGVHLTLTSEKVFYRWRPLTNPGRASGLVDEDGYFWRRVPELRCSAHPDAVEAELRAQIDAFLARGLKPVHFDAHMGAALSPEFLAVYVRLGRDYGVPILFPRSLGSYGPVHNLGAVDGVAYDAMLDGLRSERQATVERVLETPWRQDRPAAERYRDLFGAIGPGVNFMALHANAPGEIEAIEPDSAAIRTDEYAVLRDAAAGWLDALPARRGTLAEHSRRRS